jgi:cyclopropane fatty-acyl-phospholipid synthase-like methyltransferase
MIDNWSRMWDDRYSDETYAYGKQPNTFFKEQLSKLPPGHILMAAEGEGRNAVFAAKLGWNVSAFDISEEGRKKAQRLANEMGVWVDYQVGDLRELAYTPNQFDAIGLVYAHFPAPIRSDFHQLLHAFLRPGGIVIVEAFAKRHIEYKRVNKEVGGPSDEDLLLSTAEITTDFSNYKIELLEERAIELAEGKYHNGEGWVLRFVGQKPEL